MIFYRVNSTPPAIELTQADAKRSAKQLGVSWEQIDIPTDKRGLAEYIQSCWDRSEPITNLVTPSVEVQPITPKTSEPTSRSIQMDEEWDRLPLARQLDFAARAMENARAAL